MEKGVEVIEGSLEDIVERTVKSVEKYTDNAVEEIKTHIIAEASELADEFPVGFFVKGYPHAVVEERAVVIAAIPRSGAPDNSVVLSPAGIHICDTVAVGEFRRMVTRIDPIYEDADVFRFGYDLNQKWLDYGVLAAQVLDLIRQGRFDKDWRQRLEYR